LFVGFAAASILVAGRLVWPGAADRRMHAALLGATWFSVVAPLSCLFLFRAHSYRHEHMNFILWQMPFTLFGFAICGLLVAPRNRKT